jgi:DNA-binding CsgD family transcriptional regulator/PAS domain-containing protein
VSVAKIGSGSSGDALLRCIDALYDALGAPHTLADRVGELGKLLGADATAFIVAAQNGDVLRFVSDVQHDLHAQWEAHFSLLDPTRAPVLALPPGGLFTDDRLLDERLSPNPEYVHDWAKHAGLRWQRSLMALRTAEHHAVFSLLRPADAKPFGSDTHALLQRVYPDLRRFSKLLIDMHERLTPAIHSVGALDAIDVAMCVVDAQARVLHANAAAETLLRTSSPLTLRQGRLAAQHCAATQAVHMAVRQACTRPRCAGAMPLGDGGTRCNLRVAPLTSIDTSYGVTAASDVALVCIEVAPRPPAADDLISLFGFTAAEAALVRLLVRGHDLAGAAAVRGVRLSTVRSQGTSAMAKAGVRTQAQLLARVQALLPLRPYAGTAP